MQANKEKICYSSHHNGKNASQAADIMNSVNDRPGTVTTNYAELWFVDSALMIFM